MKYLTFFLVLLFTAFVYTGCQDAMQDITSPNSGTSSMQKEISFTGSAEGLTVMPFGENAPHRHFEGTGECSLVDGEVTAILDYFITSYNPGTGNGTTAFGNGTLITSDGSKLYVVDASGSFNITGGICIGTTSGKLAGGTGQFNNVLGDITMTVTMDVITRETQGTWSGTLYRVRPFSASFSGVNGVITDPGCAAGFVRKHTDGTGNVTHLGATTISLEHCFSPTVFLVTNGECTLTGADGDKLFLTYNGFGKPIQGTPTANIILNAKITGGTGKFGDAAGYLRADAIQNYMTGAATGIVEGAIDY